jgi:mRNA interferase HigB
VDFAARNPAAKASLAHWASVTKAADWQSTADVVGAFSKAKALNGERVRFEVAGGAYRLIVAFKFDAQIAFVKFIGAHADYDRIDALTVNDC